MSILRIPTEFQYCSCHFAPLLDASRVTVLLKCNEKPAELDISASILNKKISTSRDSTKVLVPDTFSYKRF